MVGSKRPSSRIPLRPCRSSVRSCPQRTRLSSSPSRRAERAQRSGQPRRSSPFVGAGRRRQPDRARQSGASGRGRAFRAGDRDRSSSAEVEAALCSRGVRDFVSPTEESFLSLGSSEARPPRGRDRRDRGWRTRRTKNNRLDLCSWRSRRRRPTTRGARRIGRVDRSWSWRRAHRTDGRHSGGALRPTGGAGAALRARAIC